MTNKKLKMAAMSVALTACVAASPLAAKADAPEAAPGEPKTEPVAEETKKEENTAEPQVNKQDEKAQETLKDAEVKYNKDNPTTNPDGSQKLDGVIVTNPEGGETNPNPNPEGGKTDPEEKKLEEKKPEEKEPEEKKPEQIGTAEKTEKTETNVETKTNPGAEPIVDTNTPPTVEKKPDGSTAITESTLTPGTETTTTTGTGTATGDLDTVVTETPKEKIDLEKELGKVNPDISWDVAKDADVGNGYTVQEVENDGNKQTLKLKKEDKTTAEMTAEDIAKLVDAEKPTVNPDGTYTLTRTETILDAEGNPQTRTTYITIQDNKVTTKTTTELTITRQKAEQDGSERVDFEVKYPEITVTNKEKPEDTKTISRELLDTILSQNPKEDGSYEYTDSDGQKYEVKVDGTAEKLNNAEIVARLQKDGHTEYTLGADGEIYYTTPHKEKVKLDVTQNELLRRSLTYTVTLKTTEKGDPGTAGEQIATEKAKKDATRDALTKAVDALGVDTATASQLKAKISSLTFTPEQLDNGGTFTAEIGGKTYTLTYSAAGATVTASTPTEDKTDTGKNPEDITDVKDNTVKGTAYVTSGTISWTAEGQKGEYTATVGDASVLNVPDGAEKIYVNGQFTGYKLTSTDNDGNTVTTTYTITYGNTSSMSPEELNRLAEQNLMEKTGCKTLEELAAAGYTNIRFENASTVTWTVTQTTQKKTTNTETLNNKTLTFEGDKNWTIAEDGNTLTYDGQTYTKDEKGNFTRTDENDKNVTYTATEQEEDVLSPEDAKAMLAKEFEVETSAIELNGTTATFTKNGSTVTVDCANLKKRTLKIERSEAASVQKTVVVTDEATLQKAYDDLWDEIKKKKGELGEGETLFVGDIEVKDTGETVKTQVIEYIKKYVTQADMTPEQLKAALKAQAEAAKTHMVTVNAGTKYEETLPNYYAGDKADIYYKTKDGQRLEWYQVEKDKNGYYYLQWNGGFDWEKVYVEKVEVKPTNIKHLDLASGAQLEKQDGTSTDCVLLNPTLKWSESAETLVKGGGTQANFVDRITYDHENDNNPSTGHYEYPRASWDEKTSAKDDNAPTKSVFYKVEGKVAYGKLGDAYEKAPGERGYAAAKQRAEADLKKYIADHPELDLSKAQVVEIYKDQTKGGGKRYYQIYLYQSDLTAYGYMSDDNNTCGNALFEPGSKSKFSYIGGYDLTLGDLTQTDEKHVVAMGKNTTALSATFKRRKLENLTNRELRYTPISETVTVVTPGEETTGSELSGSYSADYSKTADYRDEQQQGGIEGTGTGSYKSFTNLLHNVFNGNGTGTVEGGFIKYKYYSEKNEDGTPVQFEPEEMVVTTKQDAEVHYTFTSQESRDVWIKGYTQTVVPPVNPGPDTPELPPVEDAKPAPAPAPAPETPVLPVVQDARPDPAPTPAPAPETPVLPAVQDAKLIQTGTSGWLADLMLGAGMVLSAAGYWMERKRKAMFYKSQH